MNNIVKKLMDHVTSEFNPDWPEKAANLMELAAKEIERLQRLNIEIVEAMGWGSDEDSWPSGMSLPNAIIELRKKLSSTTK